MNRTITSILSAALISLTLVSPAQAYKIGGN